MCVLRATHRFFLLFPSVFHPHPSTACLPLLSFLLAPLYLVYPRDLGNSEQETNWKSITQALFIVVVLDKVWTRSERSWKVVFLVGGTCDDPSTPAGTTPRYATRFHAQTQRLGRIRDHDDERRYAPRHGMDP